MKPNKTYIIAHRGLLGNPYENTLVGIETAIASGADFVEIDVRASLDNELVAFHDRCVHRMTRSKGKVSKLKLTELKKLTFRGRTNKDLIRIPTLQECLETTKGRIGLIFEIKDYLSNLLLRKMVILAKKELSYDRFIVASRNGKLLREIKMIDPNVLTGKLGLFASLTVPFKFEKPKNYDVLIINELVASRKLVERVKRLGLNVFISCVWGIRSKLSLDSLGSDGIYLNI